MFVERLREEMYDVISKEVSAKLEGINTSLSCNLYSIPLIVLGNFEVR